MNRILLFIALLLACGTSSARAGIIVVERPELRPSAEAIMEVLMSALDSDVSQDVERDDCSSLAAMPNTSPDVLQFALHSEWQSSANLSVDVSIIIGDRCPSQPLMRGLLRPA